MKLILGSLILVGILYPARILGFQFTSDFNAGIYWSAFPVSAQKFASNQIEGQVLDSVVNQAQAAWENVVAKEIWQIPESHNVSSPFGNAIRWSNNFAADTGFNPSTTLAVTVRYRTGTFFSRFEIILNGESSVLRNNVNNVLYQTVLHELGHVIGLDHSQDQSAVMYASLRGHNNLSHDDRQGAEAVIAETQRRQEVGFVSELARNEGQEGNALACGSVAFVNDQGQGPGPGLGGMLTILWGLFSTVLFARMRQILPVRASRF